MIPVVRTHLCPQVQEQPEIAGGGTWPSQWSCAHAWVGGRLLPWTPLSLSSKCLHPLLYVGSLFKCCYYLLAQDPLVTWTVASFQRTPVVYCVRLARALVDDYCCLVPGSVQTLKQIFSASPRFCCQFITSVTALYDLSSGKCQAGCSCQSSPS